MKKNKKTNVNVKNIALFIIMIIAVGIIILVLNMRYLSALKHLNEILDPNTISSDIIIPNGIFMVTNEYFGDIESYKVVLKSLDDIVNNIFPKYYSELKYYSEDDLKNYFEFNGEIILMEVGIDNFDDFNNICTTLRKCETEQLTLKNYYIDTTTVNKKYNRVDAVMVIEYEGNQELRIMISLKNITQNKVSPIIYTVENDI